MNTFSSFEFTAFIGIDWADTKHDICIQPAGSEEREFDRIAHQPQIIEQWAHEVHKRFGGPIAVILELSKGPIVSALQKHDFFVLFPVNPLMLAKYRQAFKPSRAKDDPTDAELAVDLVLRHRDRFKPLRPQSVEMRTLAHLVEKRRRLVEDRKRFSNRLVSTLKAYYPQAVEWFSHKETFVFSAFITRWPTLKQVKRARRSTLERFFREHRVRRPNLIEARIQAIQAATALTDDPGVINPCTLEALALAEQLRTTLELIRQFDEAIAQLVPTLPDYTLFASLPGAGHRLHAPASRCLRGGQGSIPERCRGTAILRRRTRHRAQWPKVLGALAMAVLHLCTTDLRRMGSQNHLQFILGWRLLSAAAPERRQPSDGCPCSGL